MLKAVAPPAPLHPGYVSAVWYGTWEGSTATTSAMTANLLHLHVFRIFRPVRVSQLATRCQTGAVGSSIKMAIWRNGATTARPAGLAVAGSNSGQSTATSTTNAIADITDVDLQPGVYWAGAVSDGAPTMSHISASGLGTALSGSSGASNALTSQHIGFTVAQTYSNDIMALDLTGASLTYVTSSAGVPVMAMLVA